MAGTCTGTGRANPRTVFTLLDFFLDRRATKQGRNSAKRAWQPVLGTCTATVSVNLPIFIDARKVYWHGTYLYRLTLWRTVIGLRLIHDSSTGSVVDSRLSMNPSINLE